MFSDHCLQKMQTSIEKMLEPSDAHW